MRVTHTGAFLEVSIPNSPAPVEKSVNDFGITFGGQHEIAGRLLGGCRDPRLEALMRANVHLNAAQPQTLGKRYLQSLLQRPSRTSFCRYRILLDS